MSESTFNHGHFAEDTLEMVCRRIFGHALVFRSPFLETEAGKKVELTDILIVCDDIIITIQSKSIDIEASGADGTTLARVVNKYQKAKKQINRTLNASNRDVDVKLETINGVKFKLPWSMIKRKIGIVAINVRDSNYEDPDQRYQFPIKYEEHRGISVHTFILRDLFTMLAEFDTFGSFYSFLMNRKILVPMILQEYTNDLDILAAFQSNYDETFRLIKENRSGVLTVPPGEWEKYREVHAEKIRERDEKKRLTIVEVLIHEFSSYLDYYFEQNPDDHELAIIAMLTLVGALAKLDRTQRIIVDRKFREKLDGSADCKQRYFSLPIDNNAYLFVVSNEGDREIRRDSLLSMCCSLATSLQRQKDAGILEAQIERVFAFTTEGRQLEGRSFDGLAVEYGHYLEMIAEQDIEPSEMFKYSDKGRVDEWSV